jgi:hypothetical protein
MPCSASIFLGLRLDCIFRFQVDLTEYYRRGYIQHWAIELYISVAHAGLALFLLLLLRLVLVFFILSLPAYCPARDMICVVH